MSDRSPSPRRRATWAVLLCAAVAPAWSCAGSGAGPKPGEPGASRSAAARAGVTEADPADVARASVRKTVYVPAYPYVYTEDRGKPFNLAVTLYVRNVDPTVPLYLTTVRLYDADGSLARELAPRPLRIAPLASAEFFLKESETATGSAASYLIGWAATGPIGEPVVETVMIGTLSNQGIAFTCPGRVVEADAPAKGEGR
jgi:hypothetical protein